jgi:hypothetical protein
MGTEVSSPLAHRRRVGRVECVSYESVKHSDLAIIPYAPNQHKVSRIGIWPIIASETSGMEVAKYSPGKVPRAP